MPNAFNAPKKDAVIVKEVQPGIASDVTILWYSVKPLQITNTTKEKTAMT